MKRIQLGPFNRVEGDLEVALDVEGGHITAARVNSPLFRGFEQLLPGRPALDALGIVPRICGICSVAQSAAASGALAVLAGVTPPPNGQLARWLMQATENLADHFSHFYLSFMPDFARATYQHHPWHAAVAARFTAMSGTATASALPARARFLHLLGFLAGRWPHTLALQPGGSTKALLAVERVRCQAVLREFTGFVERELIGDTLANFAALPDEAALRAWAEGRAGDFPAFIRVAYDLGLEQLGGFGGGEGLSSEDGQGGGGRFLSSGAYGLLLAGVRQGTRSSVALEADKIREDVSHAWLAGGEGLPPQWGETRVDAEKEGAYTWCKAPRYAGAVLETGALARQMVAGQALLGDLVARHGASVTARITARMLELASILPAMAGWLQALVPGEPFCLPADIPDEGQGFALVEAARGTLGHWLTLRRGRIERYQIIAPTTWNFSPRDAGGTPGPLEQALVGLPADEAGLLRVQHIVRSFDPCMVCTVH